MGDKKKEIKEPNRIGNYFVGQKWILLIIMLSGILYNIGMAAGPWFEGQLAQMLFDIIKSNKAFTDMVTLAVTYVLVILFVQAARYIKRLYVRKFANNINREMKEVLYSSLVHKRKTQLEADGAGAIMTKAISDVDTCVEGMRKFTTEIFDTGVVMIAYLVMLIFYDWRLAMLSMVFPPIAYIIAEKLKKIVSKSSAAYKESAGRLNAATLDRVSNAMTYRVYGQEQNQNGIYEKSLSDYEKKAIGANIWETSMQPLYQIISSLSIFFILWFGAKNVLGTGWSVWNIAAFTTFLSCFTKLAVKSSKAAKLFNAVQKAQVSWKRIKPFMEKVAFEKQRSSEQAEELQIQNLAFRYPEAEKTAEYIFHSVNIYAKAGEIIGVTGSVASGKTTFGKVFLGEHPYEGSVKLNGIELWEAYQKNDRELAGYMGHQPELFSATVEENILLGKHGDIIPYLKAVCMDREVKEMEAGIHTRVGNGGVRLSGGQQARIALARTMYHKKPLMILDDPFSAVDRETEKIIFENLKKMAKDCIIILISHRLTVFPELSQVLWLDNGTVEVSNHKELLKKQPKYARLYQLQKGEAEDGK